jgi:hypothetical protein
VYARTENHDSESIANHLVWVICESFLGRPACTRGFKDISMFQENGLNVRILVVLAAEVKAYNAAMRPGVSQGALRVIRLCSHASGMVLTDWRRRMKKWFRSHN